MRLVPKTLLPCVAQREASERYRNVDVFVARQYGHLRRQRRLVDQYRLGQLDHNDVGRRA